MLRVRFILCNCIAAAARELSIPGVSRALHVPLGEGAVELRVRAQRAVLAVHLQRGKPISQRRRLQQSRQLWYGQPQLYGTVQTWE